MPDQTQTSFPTGNSAITWWSWRPGIKPRNAFIIGAPLTLLACFFIGVGLYTLLFGIIDSYSPPLQIPALVTGYTTGVIDGRPRLTIRLDRSGNPTIISPVIFPATHQAIHRTCTSSTPWNTRANATTCRAAARWAIPSPHSPYSSKETIYGTLHVGDVVRVVYSPHLHYVYSLKQADVEHAAGS